MKYILDTDILIYYLKNQPDVVNKFMIIAPDDIATTIINYTELLFGAYNSLKIKDNLIKIKAFLDNMTVVYLDKVSSEIFAQLKTRLKREGNMIADMDLLIASICIANDFILVTNNTKHFSRLSQLTFENWILRGLA
jgi:predicted nucleic acid-binding protein